MIIKQGKKTEITKEQEELMKDLFLNKKMSVKYIAESFNLTTRVVDRILINLGVKVRKKRYIFNEHYFDEINTEEKAYWLGFVWCDGYVCKRERKGVTYEFKLSLSEKDEEHLEKFKKSLNSNHDIKRYSSKGFKSDYKESRLYISNTYFGSVLYNKYEMIPNRISSEQLVLHVPSELIKHFIRGILDAEGSIVSYLTQDGQYLSRKFSVSVSTNETLIDFIQSYLYDNNIIKQKVKIYHRHEDRDACCREIKYGGKLNVKNILNFLYEDASIYLERKYNKYLEILNV